MHGPDGHLIAVEPGKEREAGEQEQGRLDKGMERQTQLTAYFRYNARMAAEGTPLRLTYNNAYQRIYYNRATKRWYQYQQQGRAEKTISCLRTLSPNCLELLVFFLTFKY